MSDDGIISGRTGTALGPGKGDTESWSHPAVRGDVASATSALTEDDELTPPRAGRPLASMAPKTDLDLSIWVLSFCPKPGAVARLRPTSPPPPFK